MTRDAQEAMVRLAASGGNLEIDRARGRGGRGGYLHPRLDCIDRFARNRAREVRSLRLAIDRRTRDLIAQMLRERLDSGNIL
jgi:predicted RNA-binding protein YlxR (DUF448 family)